MKNLFLVMIFFLAIPVIAQDAGTPDVLPSPITVGDQPVIGQPVEAEPAEMIAIAPFSQESLDWNAWRTLPIFYDGRVMPLETYARRTIYQICKTESPTLVLDEDILQTAITMNHLSEASAKRIRAKFPNGSRTFLSYELLFDWIAEPELWDFIPFLPAKKDFSKTYLNAGKTKYVTPYHVSEHAENLEKLLDEYEASKSNKEKITEVTTNNGKIADTLKHSYLQFRSITFDSNITTPQTTLAMVEQSAMSFMESLRAHETLKQSGIPEEELPFTKNQELEKIASKIQAVYQLYRRSIEITGEPVRSTVVEKILEATLVSMDQAIIEADKYRDSVFAKKEKTSTVNDSRLVRSQVESFAFHLAQSRLFCEAAYIALYDSEETLHVCPLLSAEGLKADRNQSVVGHPWLSLQTFRLGTHEMVRRFTGTDSDVKISFEKMLAAYNGNDPARKAQFRDASESLAQGLRHVAQTAEPMREALLPEELRDTSILAKTAMPQPTVIQAEYFYEQLRPFHNMWLSSLAAFCFLLLSAIFATARVFPKQFEITCFWVGASLLLFSELVTFTGGAFRTYFTGWLPISSKFETVVLMAFSTVAFGFWFTFYPLFGPRLMKAWRYTPLAKLQNQAEDKNTEKWRIFLFLPRLLLTAVTFYYLLLASYGELGDGKISWAIIKHSFLMNDPIDWFVVIVCIALVLWIVPRAILAVLIFPFVGKPDEEFPKTQSLHSQILQKKLFLLVAAFIAFGAGMYASKQAMNFTPLQAVLRSNFWLAVHIIAIIVSYASGAIAWLLALIATLSCLFGKWKNEKTAEGPSKIQTPWLCQLLTPYIKHLMGATVLCLAIGTILGARWADYSWGRFWGWDPKEVWALVTLLFYAIVLHGRIAKFYGDFGLVLGALAGLFAILMTWYGVNEVLKGSKHAYASSGTSPWVTMMIVTFVISNILLGTLACCRYMMETFLRKQSTL